MQQHGKLFLRCEAPGHGQRDLQVLSRAPRATWHEGSLLARAVVIGAALVSAAGSALGADMAHRESTPTRVKFAVDPAPSTYVPGPRTDTLIVGATVFDGAGGRQLADVLMRDGKIAQF